MPGKPSQHGVSRQHLIVEVEGYDGASGRIVVENDRADGSARFGTRDKIYCIATLGPDGVVRFTDWGYATANEARATIDAQHDTAGRGSPEA